jgi:hypothetical protein
MTNDLPDDLSGGVSAGCLACGLILLGIVVGMAVAAELLWWGMRWS